MRIRVKICGITNSADARLACDLGVDAIGFVFAESPRRLSIKQAQEIAEPLPPFVTRVTVMREPTHDEIMNVVSEFRTDVLQTEPTQSAYRATRTTTTRLLPVLHDDATLQGQLSGLNDSGIPHSAIILEGPGRGGRGVSPSWSRAGDLAGRMQLVLAGGLTPANVADAIRSVRPYAVDVSSGVEDRPGVKNARLLREFMLAVREAERSLSEVGAR